MNIWSNLRKKILPITAINNFLPSTGIVYEIGSGYGVLAQELGIMYEKRIIIGLDINATKIATAQKKFGSNRLKFKIADALTFNYKLCAGVVMSDFLHHIPYNSQIILLKKIEKVLKKNGVLVIKEIDKQDSWRSKFSRLWDFLLYPNDTIYYRSKTQWINLLRSLGYSVTTTRETIWFPGSTHLFICRKKLH